MQINPDRAKPEIFCVQKHELRFFCSRKFFCWFDAGNYPFAQNLYQVFEDATFVSGNSASSWSCIQCTQSLIQVQESAPRHIVCFRLVKDQVNFDKRPFLWKIGEDSENFIAKCTRMGGHPPGPLSVQVLHSDHLAGPLVELVEPAQRMSWIALEQKVCHQGPDCA